MRITIFIFLHLLSFCFQIYSQSSPSTLVKAEHGLLEGVIENGIIIYKGVPFAAPPLGDLRWRPPQPVKSWDNVFRADHYAPACPQPVIPMISDLRYGTSEDCLYLNIWKPADPTDTKLPVLVWIHGGGFTMGTASQDLLNGEQLAAKGIIVVSIAYRLGALGFMAHPGLTDESDNHASGNYGILDQIAALKWIQKNIDAFGGDPDCVTLFGESAGGQSVNILVASPLAKGLFHRAICMSGGYFGYPGIKKEEETVQLLKGAENDGIDFARRVGAETLSELRTMDTKELIKAQGLINSGFSFWPVIDGYVLTDDLYELFTAGKYHDVPVLLGTVSDEGSIFILNAKTSDFPGYIQGRFGSFADRILNLYPASPDSITKRSMADLVRDSFFGWYTFTWASLQSQTGKSPVFVYYFDQTLPVSQATLLFKSNRPFHGSDLPYVFKHLGLDPKVKYTGDDFQLSETISNYWVNFAKYGDPNGNDQPVWPAFTNDRPVAMHLKSIPESMVYPNLDKLRVLDEYYKWKREVEE